MGALLDAIDDPADLRKLEPERLPQLCAELREFLIQHASRHEGHFASSLGVVELTVALHYVYKTPFDQIVWDVGHQAYGHKVLTGRRDRLCTSRRLGGLAPFPRPEESPYDSFGVGHSSTSISAALGMAVANAQSGSNARSVAVIGDGALTGGLAFEGLNNAGGLKNADLLVVLNDNNMSIDSPVGALQHYLTDVTASGAYNRVRDEVWNAFDRFKKGNVGSVAQTVAGRLEKAIKGAVSAQSNIFEALGFRYFGPIDGHDVLHLVKVFEDLRKIPGPKLLHLSTVKGKGYTPAEQAPTYWHATAGNFDPASGKTNAAPESGPQPPKFQDVFGRTIIELARANDAVVGITPAMPTGCSLKWMMEEMPDRAFDVGICEQHAVTFAAGMAIRGMIPFCNIYSSFSQRAYDQIVHDVALQKLPVVLCLDRAGLVGADGATHHGAFDLAFLRLVPNMTVAAPMDEHELRRMMYTAQLPGKGPFAIRYPRGRGCKVDWECPLEEIPVGKGRKLRDGEDVVVLSVGAAGMEVAAACDELEREGIRAAHWDLRFAKPLDGEMVEEAARNFRHVVVVEDGCLAGGAGSAVLEHLADRGISAHVVRLGIPDRFVEHGTQAELWAECGYDAASVAKTVRGLLESK